MKESLREFLRERCGISDADLDKLERGERPHGDNTLRKGTGDSPTLHPAFAKMREIYLLIDAIQADVAQIARHDRERAAFVRGVDMVNGAGHNGVNGIDLAALVKGATP